MKDWDDTMNINMTEMLLFVSFGSCFYLIVSLDKLNKKTEKNLLTLVFFSVSYFIIVSAMKP